MTHLLRKIGQKPYGEGYDGEDIFIMAPTQYEEVEYSCVPPSIATPQGVNTIFNLIHTGTDVFRVTGLYLQWTATNSDPTNAPKFLNPYLTLQKITLKINNKEVCNHADRQAIMAQVSDYVKNFSQDELYVQLQKFRTETGTTLAGESIPVSGTQYFSLDLMVLFPILRNYIPNHLIRQITVEAFFAENNSSLLNGLYVVSNTANNAYSTNISYSNIRVKMCKHWHTEAALYKHLNPVRLLVPKWETKTFSHQSWTGSETLTIDLNTVFTRRSRILGLNVFIISPAAITAYNDADAALYYSGPAQIGYKILSRSKALVELNGASKAHERRRYLIDTHKRRYDQFMPQEVISDSSNLNKIYYMSTYIDFSQIDVARNDDYGVGGINNDVKDIEVILYSESNINAACNVYVVLHYLEVVNVINKNGDIDMIK